MVRVELRNLDEEALRDAPVTFGQVFRRGDVPAGRQVHAAIGDRPVQVDPKRRYDDGSLRFAVISAIVPELAGGEAVALTLSAEPVRASGATPAPERPHPRPLSREWEKGDAEPVKLDDLLKTDFDAAVAFTLPDGSRRATSARKLLAEAARGGGGTDSGGNGGGPSAAWLCGPVASEWIVAGAPLDATGKPDEDLNVQFSVRAYRGLNRVRVSVVVENCWDTWAGNVRYDVSVSLGGEEVFARRNVDHGRLARWRKVFWWGGEEPPLHVVHDVGYLAATGALPNYDRTLELPEPSQDLRRHLRREGPDYDILGKGALTAYMGTTGGRWEIAPYPTWTVRYLLSMDPSEKALVLAGGDLAGSWPIHVRVRATGRVMSLEDRPEFWLDERGRDRPAWKGDRHPPAAGRVRLDPDLAHQPSLAYVPYLVTGDHYYLEEAYYWAAYCLIATWPHPRQNERGLIYGQIRGDAWALRNIADAAWIAPDRHPEASYFDRMVRNNLADRIARMEGPENNKIGAWGLRTVVDARIQNPANPRWMVNVPWELDYLTWSLHHLVELGWADAARPRDFLLRQRVGMLTNAPHFDPMVGTPYRSVVGEKTPEGEVVIYEDWKKLGAENAKLSKPDLPNYGNSYAYSARAAAVCGIDGGFPRADAALGWLEANLADHRRVMAENPVWAIVPRRSVQERVKPKGE
jgi:hypothetical protein